MRIEYRKISTILAHCHLRLNEINPALAVELKREGDQWYLGQTAEDWAEMEKRAKKPIESPVLGDYREDDPEDYL